MKQASSPASSPPENRTASHQRPPPPAGEPGPRRLPGRGRRRRAGRSVLPSAVEELVHRDVQDPAQLQHNGGVRQALARLPFRHRPVRDVQPLRQLGLGQPLLPPAFHNKTSNFALVHIRIPFPPVSYPSRPGFSRNWRWISPAQPLVGRRFPHFNTVPQGVPSHFLRENSPGTFPDGFLPPPALQWEDKILRRDKLWEMGS